MSLIVEQYTVQKEATPMLVLEEYTLYKHPVSLETLAIVQFLHSLGKDVRPCFIVECHYPAWVTELPAILDHLTGDRRVGLAACVKYWELLTKEEDLLTRALTWKIIASGSSGPGGTCCPAETRCHPAAPLARRSG